ncbi:uncharacterized protein LOC115921297 [Strongylocentrotus purpuratus]|uniref:PHD-type domain-containing protein n=1 Tax=Strongylocentrotus purpuratus TaxID=7668 RepID=A0A7M7NCA8_STRPU|nr:uncharacterized protein LOC115921297 [Strongylocentrotus purpuratus]
MTRVYHRLPYPALDWDEHLQHAGVLVGRKLCNNNVKYGQRGLECDECKAWTHNQCAGVDNDTYDNLVETSFSWVCPLCEAINSSNSSSLSDEEEADEDDNGDKNDCDHGKDKENRDNRSSSKFNWSKLKKRNKFRSLNINFQSIMNKRAEWEAMIHELQPDFIHGTETWLDPSINSAEFLPEGYTALRRDRLSDRHGGVFFAYRKDLPVKRRKDLETNCEIMWCQLDIQGKRPILFGTVYKPKHDDTETVDKLAASLELINNCAKLRDIVLQGDFNQPNIDWLTSSTVLNHSASKESADKLLQTTQAYGLEQKVMQPTRLNNTLDLVLVNNSSLIDEVLVIPGLSDHHAVLTDLNVGVRKSKTPTRKIYIRQKANVEKIRQEMSDFSDAFLAASEKSVQEKWDLFESKIKLVVNEHVPSKSSSNRRNLPWFERKHRRLCREKQKLYNKAKKSEDNKDWEIYRTFSHSFRRELNSAKRN